MAGQEHQLQETFPLGKGGFWWGQGMNPQWDLHPDLMEGGGETGTSLCSAAEQQWGDAFCRRGRARCPCRGASWP